MLNVAPADGAMKEPLPSQVRQANQVEKSGKLQRSCIRLAAW